MANVERLSIALTPDMATIVRQAVESGDYASASEVIRDALREWKDLLVLGALGMGVCGAFVYIGADTTSATNIGIIYAASPILIVLLARIFYGELLDLLQGAGVLLSLAITSRSLTSAALLGSSNERLRSCFEAALAGVEFPSAGAACGRASVAFRFASPQEIKVIGPVSDEDSND